MLEQNVSTGVKDGFRWLTHTEKYAHDLIYGVPEVTLGKYLVITASDSGQLPLTEEEVLRGWSMKDGIRYSPMIGRLDEIPHQVDGVGSPGFDEFYVVDTPVNFGSLRREDIFAEGTDDQSIISFVSLFSFNLALRTGGSEYISELFWAQMSRLRPISYFSDGRDCLTFVSRDEAVFQNVLKALAPS